MYIGTIQKYSLEKSQVPEVLYCVHLKISHDMERGEKCKDYPVFLDQMSDL